ncbi:hypothetical protein [Rhizobium sp. SGZ-381]|uniref:hypothetical protein n=1 Tax=Rhizobium sp. SGZ-381 TaxID=3342800 RepID=UPI003671418B
MKNAFLVLIASALIGDFNVVGRVTGSEVFLIPIAVVAIFRPGPNIAAARQFYIFIVLWAFGAFVSDIINGSTFEDYSRGWAKIIFFGLNFTALRWLIGTDRTRIIVFIYALAVATAARIALGRVSDELADDVFGNSWKFGYGQLFTMTTLLISAHLLRMTWSRPFGMAAPFAAAAVSLLMNARNLTGLTTLAGLISAMTAGRKRPFPVSYIIGIAVAAGVAGLVVINIYEYSAGQGLLGREAQDKYLQQSQGNLNILLAGRTESLASTQAIIDAPILGHGSWARNINYVMLMLNRMAAEGLEVRNQITSDLIPSHSHLLGAWVEHGVLGAAFWFWAVYVTLKGLLGAAQRPTPYTGFVAFIGLSLLWDTFFSPFGLERRVVTAAWLYCMMLYGQEEVG